MTLQNEGGGKVTFIAEEAFLPLQNRLWYAHVGGARDVSLKSGNGVSGMTSIFAFAVQ
jgi:hypothetical protein